MLKTLDKSNGQTGIQILLEAMSKDKIHLARFILDALDGKIVDSKTESTQTPLISSVLLPDYSTRSKFMELLLQRGAHVNYQDHHGRTALSHACEKGYLDAVKMLVSHSADPEMVDDWGNTGLMYAAVAGHSHIVAFLVKAFKRLGLQIDRQNKVGNSAVEVAKFLGHTDCFFALTSNNTKRVRENSGPHESAPSQVSVDTANEKRFEKRLEPLIQKLDVIQKCITNNDQITPDDTWQPKPTSRRGSLILRSRLQSMDSIQEFDGESDSSPSSPHDLFFSGALTPRPPSTCRTHSPVRTAPKSEEKLSIDYLPPLRRAPELQTPTLYSPRPGRNVPKPRTTIASPNSPLGILLTPIYANNKSENELDKEKQTNSDLRVRRFDDSYYQKRCSLPTSILSPTPPDRTSTPLRATKTMRARHASPSINTETFEPSATVVSPTTFSVLGTKLLRRFTFPEFKKAVRAELQDGARNREDPSVSSACLIPRSETFPKSTQHPQVGSKPSIDSISAVKCEFDFHFKAPVS